jgi:hypothetical protein
MNWIWCELARDTLDCVDYTIRWEHFATKYQLHTGISSHSQHGFVRIFPSLTLVPFNATLLVLIILEKFHICPFIISFTNKILKKKNTVRDTILCVNYCNKPFALHNHPFEILEMKSLSLYHDMGCKNPIQNRLPIQKNLSIGSMTESQVNRFGL